MKLRGIVAEDFCNYRMPSLFLASTKCDWKCCVEQGIDISVCQNNPIASTPVIDIYDWQIYNVFISNPITKAVVIGGLEPLLQFDEIHNLIHTFREYGEQCDFVIYTGYYPYEILREIAALSQFQNIVMKFGRYIPDRPSVYDDVLGVNLASNNQFAVRLSQFRDWVD